MKLLWLLTGGRPMRRTSFAGFWDPIGGEIVAHYQDRLGRRWLATGPWSLFRVPTVR